LSGLSEFRDSYGQQWLEVERLPQSLDLGPVAGALSQYRIAHRITEERGEQVVWVAREEDREAVAKFIADWRRGELQIIQQRRPRAGEARAGSRIGLILRMLPVTSLLLLFSLLGYLLVLADSRLLLVQWFTIVDYLRYDVAGLADLDLSQFWRLWTPMFLHFDIMHVTFNALFIWVFGARLERVMGSGAYLLFVLAVGLVANLGQLGWDNYPVFGGMSGVNYGLIGYIWLRQMLAPHPLLVFPKALIPMLLVMLLLGTFGVIDIFIEGQVANAAHISGLLAGMSWGLFAGLYASRRSPGTSNEERDEQ